MKTYTKTIQKNRLLISHDDCAMSPREWDNLGYFITCDNRYNSPDENETIQYIIKNTEQEANNQAEHMELIKKDIQNELKENVLAIYPISKYEHSNIYYSIGSKKGFDYSNNGFYIVTDRKANILGTPKASFEKVIQEELEEYNKYINGEVYEYILYDEHGEIEESCGGFYSIEDIKEHLPKEWENEDLLKYLID